MTIYFVCLQDYANTTAWILMKKIETMGSGIESDLNHYLNTKTNFKGPDLPIYLLLRYLQRNHTCHGRCMRSLSVLFYIYSVNES